MATDALGDVERQVLHDVRQEHSGERLAEVKGDAGGNASQLASGQGGDREADDAFLDDRSQPRTNCSGSRLSVAESLRPAVERPAIFAPTMRRADPDDERDHQTQGDHERDRGEREEDVAGPALATRDGVLERAPAPLGSGDRGAVDDREETAEAQDERTGSRRRRRGNVTRTSAAWAAARVAGSVPVAPTAMMINARRPASRPRVTNVARPADELAQAGQKELSSALAGSGSGQAKERAFAAVGRLAAGQLQEQRLQVAAGFETGGPDAAAAPGRRLISAARSDACGPRASRLARSAAGAPPSAARSAEQAPHARSTSPAARGPGRRPRR